jgi:hypothetical protein
MGPLSSARPHVKRYPWRRTTPLRRIGTAPITRTMLYSKTSRDRYEPRTVTGFKILSGWSEPASRQRNGWEQSRTRYARLSRPRAA